MSSHAVRPHKGAALLNQLKQALGAALLLSALSISLCCLLQIQLIRSNSFNSTGIALYLYSIPTQVGALWLWLGFRHHISVARALVLSVVALSVPAILGLISIVAVYLCFGGQL